MAPGNAWHIPGSTELPGNVGMRNPAFPPDANTELLVYSGNQFTGGNTAADQRGDRSFLKYKQTDEKVWTSVGMEFNNENGNNKYFRARIPLNKFAVGSQLQYYFVLGYNDRDETYLGVAENDPTGWFSGTLANEGRAQARPFVFTIGKKKQQKPFTYSIEKPEERGKWDIPFKLPTVGAHAHLLFNGNVLMWGRRDNFEQSMNTFPAGLTKEGDPAKAATCTPFILDLTTEKTENGQKTVQSTRIGQPFTADGSNGNKDLPKTEDGSDRRNANLFCSGHAFLPNGQLLVAGGHLFDQHGLDQSCIYDPAKNSWTAVAAAAKDEVDITKAGGGRQKGTVMGKGRWYPTVTTLPTGAVLVTSGSYRQDVVENVKGQTQVTTTTPINNNTQIFSIEDGVFSGVDPTARIPWDLYPRIHVASSGIIYLVSLADIWFLDLSTEKKWRSIEGPRDNQKKPLRAARDYACSVMYDKDKIAYIGGGNDPTATTDLLDLSDRNKINWVTTNPMAFARRQHNATILADGKVLVTGGTRGNGAGATVNPDDVKFNDLRPGRPVHVAELWNPKDNSWSIMASEQFDRCYHATAVLLPDGRVLSAGSGEFQLNGSPNDDQDSQDNAQIFSPPYLFLPGPRPNIDSISKKTIEYGSGFQIVTADPGNIEKIHLIGLSSVTHSNNSGQRLVPLTFDSKSRPLQVTAPRNASSCPPGYYMLFIVNLRGFPSKAVFVQIVADAKSRARHREFTAQIVADNVSPPTLLEVRKEVRDAAEGTRIELGINPTCPYGLSACWGGAFEALSNLQGVSMVDPVPHSSGSSASVFLVDDGLPDLNLWTAQFKGFVRETYTLRGFEAAVTGTVKKEGDGIFLLREGARPQVKLSRLEPDGKIQQDRSTRRPQIPTNEETGAYDTLAQSASSGSVRPALITGPISQTEAGYILQVRLVKW